MSHLRHHRPAKLRARNFQFSIGRLLVLMTVCAAVLSFGDVLELGSTLVMGLIVLAVILLFADFKEAVEHALKAVEQAPSLWHPTLEARLATFRAGRPLRDLGEPVIDAQRRVSPQESDDADNTGQDEADHSPMEKVPQDGPEPDPPNTP